MQRVIHIVSGRDSSFNAISLCRIPDDGTYPYHFYNVKELAHSLNKKYKICPDCLVSKPGRFLLFNTWLSYAGLFL